MKPVKSLFCALVACWWMAGPAWSAPVANSALEFSGVQGQDAWTYGFFNLTAKGSAYTPADFVRFDTFNNVANLWQASAGQVGSQNNEFLSINQVGGHPTGITPDLQDSIIWAIRRYTSEVSGPILIDFDLHKQNINFSGGVTGHILIDGVEVFNARIFGTDGIGQQGSILRTVSVGSVIDFAIDPVGFATIRDIAESTRSDGSVFSSVISTAAVPEPGSAAVVGLGLVLLASTRRTQQRMHVNAST